MTPAVVEFLSDDGSEEALHAPRPSANDKRRELERLVLHVIARRVMQKRLQNGGYPGLLSR